VLYRATSSAGLCVFIHLEPGFQRPFTITYTNFLQRSAQANLRFFALFMANSVERQV
jgi:hypothetical protein